MLNVENIVKYYKKTNGAENLSFKLNSGKALGIIGINGSGKTTTFRVLLGLLKADSGKMTFNNKELAKHPATLLGYLPEERSLYRDLTLVEHVLFLGKLKKVNEEDILKRLDKLLVELKISKYKYTKINKLSKGNQQKVQIICALIHDPEIIILDEPLSGLDVINVELLKRLINKLKYDGKYILLSSHQFEHIEEFCDDLIILKNGDVQYYGSVEDLINMSKHYYLIVDKDIGIKYLHNNNIIDSKISGNEILLQFESKEILNNIFRQILEKEDYKNISIKQPSIEMVVKENSLIWKI